MGLIFSILFVFLQSFTTVVVVLDDDHPASAGILGYRWNMDGTKSSVKIKKTPPCLACLERTYTLNEGTHWLIVTPYTAKGDIEADAVTMQVEVTIGVENNAQDKIVRVTMRPIAPTAR
jgi:hypothetical protein